MRKAPPPAPGAAPVISSNPNDPNFGMYAPVVEVPKGQKSDNPVKVTVNINGPHKPTTKQGLAQAKTLVFDDPD